MKIIYHLSKMAPLMIEHIYRNIAFDNVDLVYNAGLGIERLEKSRLNKHLPIDMQLMMESMKDKGQRMVDDLEKMFNLEVVSKGGGLVDLKIYVSPDYFITGDSIEARFGRLGKRIVSFQTRQGIIDGIEKSLRNTYHVPFVGEIIEDDGKKLRIGSS